MGVGVAVRGRGSVPPDLLLVPPPTVGECRVCCHSSSRYIRNNSLTDSHTFTTGQLMI